MVLVSVQYIDAPEQTSYLYNGGFGIQFYNLDEAKLFAQSESSLPAGSSASRGSALCRVYNDGVNVMSWENGINITG